MDLKKEEWPVYVNEVKIPNINTNIIPISNIVKFNLFGIICILQSTTKADISIGTNIANLKKFVDILKLIIFRLKIKF